MKLKKQRPFLLLLLPLSLAMSLAISLGMVLNTYADVLLIGETPTVITQENSPISGMTKQTVLQKYGQPLSQYTSSGRITKRNPQISVWTYASYKVYFENRHVIHTLIRTSTPDES